MEIGTKVSAGIRKGAWTKEEDNRLRNCIEKLGEGQWHRVPHQAGLNRCRKSCRLRWLNYLSPNIIRGKFSRDEMDLIDRLHKLLGNRWSLIAGRLPGRTANDIKNFWNTHMSKKSWTGMPKTINKSLTGMTKTIKTGSDVKRPRPLTFTKQQLQAAKGQACVEEQPRACMPQKDRDPLINNKILPCSTSTPTSSPFSNSKSEGLESIGDDDVGIIDWWKLLFEVDEIGDSRFAQGCPKEGPSYLSSANNNHDGIDFFNSLSSDDLSHDSFWELIVDFPNCGDWIIG